MAAQTGSTYKCESMTDNIIITILTATLRFSTLRALGDFNNDRLPEMAPGTRDTYISETMIDSVEISTANLEFTARKSVDK